MSVIQPSPDINMIVNGVSELGLRPGNQILELDHGNCPHLEMLLSQATGLKYHGLEVSSTLIDQVMQANINLRSNGHVVFKHYLGHYIPFQDSKFDKILAVNCSSLIENPIVLLSEMYRVLRPEGRVVMVFSGLDSIPLSSSNLKFLFGKIGFEIIQSKTKRELRKNDLNDFEEWKYRIVILGKKH